MIPNILQRTEGLIELQIQRDPLVSKYRLLGALTLDKAFSTADELFEVEAGKTFLSPSIQANPRRYPRDEKRKGTTILFNLNDYYDPTNPATADLPHDGQFLFLTVQEYSVPAGAYLAQGPILIVQTADFFNLPKPALTLYGTAPNNAAVAGAHLPAGYMHFHLPAVSRSFTIRNLDGANPLFISLAPGMPAVKVLTWTEISVPDGMTDQFLIGAANNNVNFTVSCSIGNIDF